MIYITGDIHGIVSPVRNICMRCSLSDKDIVILLGDVGANYAQDSRDDHLKKQLSDLPPTFFCIHGNHECRPQNILSYKEMLWQGGSVMYEERFPKLLFPVDGEIFTLNGQKCLVIGGAYSVDKEYRIIHGKKWFPDEQPSAEIKKYVEKQIVTQSIDVILSHTCPKKYIPTECFLSGINQSAVDSSTEEWLDTIEEKVPYKAWYCGHWHTNKHFDRMHFLYHDAEMLIDT